MMMAGWIGSMDTPPTLAYVCMYQVLVLLLKVKTDGVVAACAMRREWMNGVVLFDLDAFLSLTYGYG